MFTKKQSTTVWSEEVNCAGYKIALSGGDGVRLKTLVKGKEKVAYTFLNIVKDILANAHEFEQAIRELEGQAPDLKLAAEQKKLAAFQAEYAQAEREAFIVKYGEASLTPAIEAHIALIASTKLPPRKRA